MTQKQQMVYSGENDPKRCFSEQGMLKFLCGRSVHVYNPGTAMVNMSMYGINSRLNNRGVRKLRTMWNTKKDTNYLPRSFSLSSQSDVKTKKKKKKEREPLNLSSKLYCQQ